MYERFVGHLSADVGGLHGFAEWPDGQTIGPDSDSGPVLFGSRRGAMDQSTIMTQRAPGGGRRWAH